MSVKTEALEAHKRLWSLIRNLHGLRLEGEPKPIDMTPHLVELGHIYTALRELQLGEPADVREG